MQAQSIDLKSNGKIIFKMPAPYMYDSSNNFSDDIKVCIEKYEEGYKLTYIPSNNWLRSEERSYPVVIDPSIESSRSFLDAYVSSDSPKSNYGSDQQLRLGNTEGEGIFDVYLKANLPQLYEPVYITNAKLRMCLSGLPYSRTAACIYQVTSNWSESTITYNKRPKNDKIVLDYYKPKSIYDGQMVYDITSLATQWYNGTVSNYGVLVSSAEEGEALGIYSSESEAGLRPTLEITYQSALGTGTGGSFEEFDLKKAGTMYLNDYTGNLCIIRDDIGMEGNVMPVRITMIYNSLIADSGSYPTASTGNVGFGWKINYQQNLKYHTTVVGGVEREYYEYLSDTGTVIYFEKQDVDGEFVDASGSGYVMKADDADLMDYTLQSITGKDGEKYYFDNLGRLKKIVGNYPATSNVTAISNLEPLVDEAGVIRIDYRDDNGGLNIEMITDGAGRQYLFNYNESGYLESISFLAEDNPQIVSYYYEYKSGGRQALKTVYYNRKEKANYFTDSSSTKIKGAESADRSGMSVLNTERGRIKELMLYDTDGEAYKKIKIERKVGRTEYTESISGKKKILQFNKEGNVTCIQDEKGHALFGGFDGYTNINSILDDISDEYKSVNNLIKYDKISLEEGCQLVDAEQGGGLGNTIKVPARKLSAINYVTEELDPGIYTFSIYVKGCQIALNVNDIEGKSVETLNCSSSTGEKDIWVRLFQTVHISEVSVLSISIDNNSIEPIYCEGLQLERGELGEYNLVKNGDFNDIESQNDAKYWKKIGEISNVTYSKDKENASPVSEDYLFVQGSIDSIQGIEQQIEISGKKGEDFTFGAYAKAAALPDQNEQIHVFHLQAKVIRADSVNVDEFPEDKIYVANFNSYSTDWQYSLNGFTTEYDYKGIELSVHYDYQLNDASFDGIQCYKTPFVTNAVYKNGKLDFIYELNNTEKENDNILDSGQEIEETIETETDQLEDIYGRVISYKDKSGVTVNTEYDEFNNVLTNTNTDGNKKIVESSVYTPEGNFISTQTDNLGRNTKYEFNEQLGLLESVQVADNKPVMYVYDSNMRLTKISQSVSGLANGKKEIKNEYSFDIEDNITAIKRNEFEYKFIYNPFGQIYRVMSPIGDVVTYNYQSRKDSNKLSGITYGNGQNVQYEFSDNNILTAVKSGENINYRYYHDLKGNTVAKMDYVNNIQTILSTDEQGNNVIEQNGINGNVFSNYFCITTNREERKFTETQKYNGITYQTMQEMDEAQRYKNTNWIFKEKQNEEDVSYDTLGRVDTKCFISGDFNNENAQEITDKKIILNQQYEYKDMGAGVTSDQIEQISFQNSAGYHKVLTYQHDRKGNILSENNVTYTYDQANQLVRVDDPARGTTTYLYDAGGNLRETRNYPYTPKEPTMLINKETYDYHNEWKDLLISYNGKEITYDKIGNPLTYYNGTSFGWKLGRQLDTVTVGNHVYHYKYDDEGIRMQKSIGDQLTKYIYMDSRLAIEEGVDYLLYFRYDGNGEVIGFDYSDDQRSGTYFYVKNLFGDIIGILDHAGREVVSYQYDEWGKILNIKGTDANTIGEKNPLRYRGYYYDKETGFYYLKSRYYDPNTKRFLNADVHFNIQDNILGTNVFAYCYNNPINMVDSDGEIAKYGYAMLGILFVVTAAYTSILAIKFTNTFRRDWSNISIFSTATLGNYLAGIAGTYTWIVSKSKAISKKIEQSFAKVKAIDKPNRRRGNERHHIVAKQAYKAQDARDALKAVGINWNNDKINLIWIKYGLHRRIHNNEYYTYVNTMVVNAFNTGVYLHKHGKKKSVIKAKVAGTLRRLKGFITSLNNAAPF